MSDWQAHPHRRFNPLLGSGYSFRRIAPTGRGSASARSLRRQRSAVRSYVLPVSRKRTRERRAQPSLYRRPIVFDNDFAALLPDTPDERYAPDDLLLAQSERGTCRVLCFSPRHDLHLASMTDERDRGAWSMLGVAIRAALAALPDIDAVTIFENRGAMMGASNPHPHGQIWAERKRAERPRDRNAHASGATAKSTARCLLCAYVERERRDGERIVYANEHFVALVPFWAVWPFEVLLLGTRAPRALWTSSTGRSAPRWRTPSAT